MQHATKKKGLLFPLDIQLFAEGDGDGGKGGNPNPNPNPDNNKQKYSDEEYLKLKANFDKTSSEIAELKKQLKSKQTDDEKKAEEEQNRLKEMDELKKQVTTYKIEKSLLENFAKEEVEKISKPLIEGNIDDLIKTLNDIRKAYKEKIYAEAKEEFSKSAKIPGGKAGEDDVPSDIQAYIDSKKSKGKVDARNYWFGKKE